MRSCAVSLLNEEEEMSTVTLNLGSGIRYAQIEDLQPAEETAVVPPWMEELKKLVELLEKPENEIRAFVVAYVALSTAAVFAVADIVLLMH